MIGQTKIPTIPSTSDAVALPLLAGGPYESSPAPYGV